MNVRSLEMMSSVLNSDPILVYCTKRNWCTGVSTVPNVPKMTKNYPSVPKSYLIYQQKH